MVAKINRGNSLCSTLIYNYEKIMDNRASIISGQKVIMDITGKPENTIQQLLRSFEYHLLENKRIKKHRKYGRSRTSSGLRLCGYRVG